jgi:hypothetical protein
MVESTTTTTTTTTTTSTNGLMINQSALNLPCLVQVIPEELSGDIVSEAASDTGNIVFTNWNG